MRQIGRTVLPYFTHAGVFDMPHSLCHHRLTVLAYHRIANPSTSDFDTFKSNVSATPTDFAAQMDFVRKRFEPVSVENILAWLRGEQILPDHPVLITFDDGYRDNLDFAFPILQERRMPAVIFLATDYIGQDAPFYWDLIAYCFHHTSRKDAYLPLSGQKKWHDEKSRTEVMRQWLQALKKLPDDDKWVAVRKLPQALSVLEPEKTVSGPHLSWDHVRKMAAAGIDMGAHTQSHPILTRISLEKVESEVSGSKERIEKEIGKRITVFAYPNGLRTDYNAPIQNILKQVGFEAAFTLLSGPSSLAEVKQEPMAIRRVFIHHKDTLLGFAAKLMGVSRVIERFM